MLGGTLPTSPARLTTIVASMFVNINKTTHPWPGLFSQGQSGSASTFQRTFQVLEAGQDSG